MTGEEYWIKATSSGLSTVEHPWYCSLPVYVKRSKRTVSLMKLCNPCFLLSFVVTCAVVYNLYFSLSCEMCVMSEFVSAFS